MRGLNCRGLDFSRPELRAPLAGLAAVVLLALLAVIGWRQWQLQRQEAEIAVLSRVGNGSANCASASSAACRPARRKNASWKRCCWPRATMDAGCVRRCCAIEQAWTPRLGMLTLHLEGAGRQARLELSAADPGAIFQFLSALNRGPARPPCCGRADDPRRAALATIQVTLR